jgi:hypothetical protein
VNQIFKELDKMLMSDMFYAQMLWTGMILCFLGQLEWISGSRAEIVAFVGMLTGTY